MNILKSAVKYICNADYRWMLNDAYGLYKNMPDEEYLKKKFRIKMGYDLDIEHPKTFNEKLQWLKLYDRKPIYTTMVDKAEAKKYVADIIGEEYIIPTLGIWDSVEDIDFDRLPMQFVLKCTHDSHGLVICKDKSTLNIAETKKKLSACLKRNYYYKFREWPYKNVKPRIIAEKYMEEESGELKDYKVLCFDGVARLIELHQGRFTGTHYQDFYDIEWNKTDIKQVHEIPYPKDSRKPECLDEMLRLSGKLSEGIPHVRVDWYVISGQLYFGECTFYDASGFDPFNNIHDDLMLGSWIKVV